jgi:Fic family protein
MRIPKRPPPLDVVMKRVKQTPDWLVSIIDKVTGPTVNGTYVHWDKLRHLDPPDGLDHESWWLGLKLNRLSQRKFVPLKAVGLDFSFILADPLPELLHHADSGARGSIGAPEAVMNRETRDQYMFRSLVEESITSSQLEGASTTRDVAKKMIREGREPRDRDERMILNNFRTMQEIIRLKDEELTKDLVLEIQRIATQETLDDDSGSGRFRKPEEDIVVGDDLGQVFHTPPPAGQLDRRIAAMCDFANGRSPGGFIHPMIRSMILHFWLAYDHPFIDGNGRTARALFYWSMLRHGYWLFEFISISRIILRGPTKYGRAFLETETDDNDLTYFLLYHAEIIRRAIDELHRYIEERTRRLLELEADLRGLTALNHRQRDLVSQALRHPGQRFSIESHRKSHDTVYETARSDLMDLVERALFTKRKVGRTWYFEPAPDLETRLRRDR